MACERAGSRSHVLDLLKQHRSSLGGSNVGVCHPVNRRWEVLDVDRVIVIERRLNVGRSRVMVRGHTVVSNSPSSLMRPLQAMKLYLLGQISRHSEAVKLQMPPRVLARLVAYPPAGLWSRIRNTDTGIKLDECIYRQV